MRVSYRWLKDYVDFDLTPAALAEKLTMAGFEIEDVQKVGGGYTGVTTALIEKVERHPDAEKPTLCTVFDGAERLTVICGAPNVAAGKVGALAKVGAELPEGKLKKTKIRGVESLGMLCSRRELGLDDDHSGIWLMPADTPLGKEPLAALGLDDWALEINVTPNRPDALSVIGLAREIAALVGAKLKLPNLGTQYSIVSPDLALGGEIDAVMKVEISAPDKCPRYCGILVKGVKIAPSPLWMVHRLTVCGVRAINNIVDITNFVLLEYGQPLHAFDQHFLEGGKIVVRRAGEGETIVTLDDQERKLTADDLLICDGARPVALAGVMGGQNSLVTDQTVDVFIESANFEPAGIRRTSKRTGLASESSHRFERGVGIDVAPAGAHRAARLMEELAGGKVVPGFIDAYPSPRQPLRITMRPAKVNALLGTALSAAEMTKLLESIELKVEQTAPDALTAVVPSFRVDLTREVDLAEEIARLYGYGNIAATVHMGVDGENRPWRLRHFLNAVRRELVGAGLTELNTLAFIDERSLAATGAPAGLKLANPLSEDLATMRTSLLPSLLKTLAYNQARRVDDVHVFEARRVYLPGAHGELPQEPYRLGLLLAGRRNDVSWATGKDAADFFDLKGAIERLLAALRAPEAQWRAPNEAGPYLPGVCAEVWFGEEKLGVVGKVKPETLEFFEAKGAVFAGELNLELLASRSRATSAYRPISKYPPVLRDIAVLVDFDAPVEEMEKTIAAVNPERITEVKTFDAYTGKGVPEGKKSIAFSMRYQDLSKSLSDKDADKLTNRILQTLGERYGSSLRE